MYTRTHTVAPAGRPCDCGWRDRVIEREGGREFQQFVGPTWKAVPKLTLNAHYDICAQFARYIAPV